MVQTCNNRCTKIPGGKERQEKAGGARRRVVPFRTPLKWGYGRSDEETLDILDPESGDGITTVKERFPGHCTPGDKGRGGIRKKHPKKSNVMEQVSDYQRRKKETVETELPRPVFPAELLRGWGDKHRRAGINFVKKAKRESNQLSAQEIGLKPSKKAKERPWGIQIQKRNWTEMDESSGVALKINKVRNPLCPSLTREREKNWGGRAEAKGRQIFRP